VIRDGASYHKSNLVKEAPKERNITFQLLPAYSPDFIPNRASMAMVKRGCNVTYHACHKDECELIEQVRLFENHITSMPLVVTDRLWTKRGNPVRLEVQQQASIAQLSDGYSRAYSV